LIEKASRTTKQV